MRSVKGKDSILTKQLEKPAWAETGNKTQGLINRTLVLWELQRQGKLDLRQGAKVELAKSFGVSRMALNRSLAAVVDAQAEVDRMLRKVDPTYLSIQSEMAAVARQRYAQRNIPGEWVDEDQYKQMLQVAGIEE